MGSRLIERVLILEDEASLRITLERALRARYPDVRAALSVAEGRTAVSGWVPDLALLDVELPDGTAADFLETLAELEAVPVVVAMSGSASPSQSFDLAQLGVRTYLPKPIDLESLERAIQEAAESPPDLRPQVRSSVGYRPIHEVEEEVRRTMLSEALARAQGSKRGAAKLLQVSRQLIQHMLRRHDDL